MQEEVEPAARNRRPVPDLTFHYRRRHRRAQPGARDAFDLRAPARELIVESNWSPLQETGTMMRKILWLAVLALTLGTTLAVAADPRSEAKAQVKFGIEVAQKGLWKSAMHWWEKAVEIDPTYAAAYNNLAVAYEHEGLFDKARQAYEKALSLDPKNESIRQNFEFFKEINDRASRRTTR
jgi:tetratricopeptide (TPR) repeat protein